METFRGLICNNYNDFRAKEQLIHNFLNDNFGGGRYTSVGYAGRGNKADIYTTDGKPILVEPKQQDWADAMPTLPLNFTDLDKSIIDKGE